MPEPLIYAGGARVMGLDDPTKKMSKSAGSAANYIALSDVADVIRRKIQRAVTDSGTDVRAGRGQAGAHQPAHHLQPAERRERRADRRALRRQGLRRLQARPGRGGGRGAGAVPAAPGGAAGRPGLTRSACSQTAPSAPRPSPTRTLAKVRERVGLVPRPSDAAAEMAAQAHGTGAEAAPVRRPEGAAAAPRLREAPPRVAARRAAGRRAGRAGSRGPARRRTGSIPPPAPRQRPGRRAAAQLGELTGVRP